MCCEPGVPAAAPADAQRAAAFCGAELGRWITPFMRGIGRWLTDVTPLFPLLTGQRCSFNLYTDSWAMPWVDSLALRFRNLNGSSSSASAADVAQPEAQQQRQDDATGQGTLGRGRQAPRPRATLRWHPELRQIGTCLSAEYRDESPCTADSLVCLLPRTSFPLVLVSGCGMSCSTTTRTHALLYTVITGHGSDNNNCGEFCVTSHVFYINGRANNLTFDDAGTEWGCTASVPAGGIPNEHGVWGGRAAPPSPALRVVAIPHHTHTTHTPRTACLPACQLCRRLLQAPGS